MKSSTTNVETSINEEVFHEVSAMQEELDQFARLKVWRLVPRPEGKYVIKTKWIFKNKKDKSNLFIRNKARLDFTVFQMVVKTMFLNGILKEKVYVGQPPGFVSQQYPDHVYALDKALYGLKQAPRAWIFCYIKGTINLGLLYSKDSGFDLTAYSDADHAGCHLDRKSTSGSVQFLGDKLVCWSYKKQNYVSISTAESGYVAVSSCCAQVLWMRTQLTDCGFFYDKVLIYCYSKSAIAISCNLQKVKDDKEKAELKQLMETIPIEEEVEIDAISLAVKSPWIIDWKIHKEGKKSYYQIIYMLVKKKYPLTPPTLSMMLEKKLEIDYESKMAYQGRIVGIKSLLNAVGITVAQVFINTALMKLVLLRNFKKIFYIVTIAGIKVNVARKSYYC
nr:uncharacterized mitochondrial protein AtMg00810-like [Tanacetum cinerariifolium]